MNDIKWLKERHITHRGFYTDDIPENSLEAFHNAIKNGYDIELDLQLTKDNRIVVFHDKSLLRLCGVNKKVENTLYDDIKKLYIGNSSSKIPLLEEVLNSVPETTYFMFELKTGRKYKKLVSLFLEMISKYSFTYVVHSFDLRIIYQFKKKVPNVPRGYILRDNNIKCKLLNYFIRFLPIHSVIKPDFYVYKFEDLPNRKMDKLKKKGYPILAYTAKSEEDLQHVKSRYDNAIFEGFIPKKEKKKPI